MKDIRIDFTKSEPCLDSKELGEYGEKGVERFAITPPAEMSKNDKITNYVVAFGRGGKSVRLPAMAKEAVLYVPVEKAAVGGTPFDLQLEGHDNTDSLIMKTPVVKNFYFGESVPEADCNGVSNCPRLHFHENLLLLDGLKDVEGRLTYNGKHIGTVASKTREFSLANGDAMCFINHSVWGSVHFIIYGDMPVGVKILKLEVKFNLPEAPSDWLDINGLYAGDNGYFPTVTELNRSFLMQDYGGVCVGIKYYMNDTADAYYDAFVNGNVSAVRVTYSDESEDA